MLHYNNYYYNVLYIGTIITFAAEPNGLKFNSTSSCYEVTVTEARADDANTDIATPPAPASSAAVTTACTRSDGTAVTDSSDLRYSLLDGNQTLFSIGELSGAFMVAHEALDYEEQSSYLVHILCYLDSDRRSNATGAVNVTVVPLNEYLPQISRSGSLILPEHIPVGTRVAVRVTTAETQGGALFTYDATDKDRGPDGIITFLLTVEDHLSYNQDVFDLDAASGTLILKRQLDVDNLPGNSMFDTLDVTITACNADTAFNDCHNIALAVFIVPANDNKPQFIPPHYTAEVLESAAKQALVLQVTCKDEDKHKTVGSLTANAIALGSGTFSSVENVFDVNSTGAVILRGELDYEKTTSYQFELTCSDGNTTTSAEVSVAVLPVNDNAPRFINDSYKFILEREPAEGSLVGQVEARDDDIETGSTITYSMEKNSYFVINNKTGEIYYIHRRPRVEENSTVLMVTASDGEFTDQTMAEFILLQVNNSAASSSSTAVIVLAVFISLLTFLSL